MTVAQIEHAATLRPDPLPAEDLFDRMESLIRDRRAAIFTTADRRIRLETFEQMGAPADYSRRVQYSNELTTAAMRQAEIEREIIEVARLLVAEADNAEMANTI
jgi:hypothetical protein